MKTAKRAKSGVWWSVVSVAVLTASVASGGPSLNASKKFSFQGVVSGIPDGDYEMKVDAIGGVTNHSVIFDSTRKVPVRGGVFTLLIDEADGLLPAHFYKSGGTSFSFTLHVDHDPNQAGYDSVFSGIPVTAVPVAFVAHQALDTNRLGGVDINYPATPTGGALSASYDGQVFKLKNGIWELAPDDAGSTSVVTTIANGLVPMLPSTSGSTKFLDGTGSWQGLPSAYSLPVATTSALGGVKIPASGALSLDGSNVLSLAVGTAANTVAAGNDVRLSAFTASQDGLVPKPTTAAGKFLKDDGTWGTPTGYTLPVATTTLGGVKSNSTKAVEIDGAGELDVKLATSSGLQKSAGNMSIKLKTGNPLSINGSNELNVAVGTTTGTVAAGDDPRFGDGVPVGTVITSVVNSVPNGYVAPGSILLRTGTYGNLYSALTTAGTGANLVEASVTAAVPSHDEFYALAANDAGLMRFYEPSTGGNTLSQRSVNNGTGWSTAASFQLTSMIDSVLTTPATSGNVWVAKSGGYYSVSSDGGLTWGTQQSNPSGSGYFGWTGSTFVFVGSSGIYASNDPSTGTWGTMISSGGSMYDMATDGAGNNVYFTSNQYIKKTADLAPSTGNFNNVYDAGSGTYFLTGAFAYSGSKFCGFATGTNNKTVTSPTGATWTDQPFPSFWISGSNLRLYGFNANGGTFAALMSGGAAGNAWWKLYMSSDCVNWTLKHEEVNQSDMFGSNFYPWKVAASESRFYMVNINTGKTHAFYDDGNNFSVPNILNTDGLFRYIKY